MTEEQLLQVKAQLYARAKKKFPDDPEKQNAYVWSVIRRIKENNHA